MYVMLDLYTRLIVAVSIGFDNNSVLGFTNCLMNLADDKVEYCKKYGLTITETSGRQDIYPNASAATVVLNTAATSKGNL